MMMTKYPNVELLAYRAEQIFNDEVGKYLQQETEMFSHYIDTQVYVFRQTWANTATGINLHGGVSGQAFTNAYTTVVQIDFEAENQDPEVGVERNYFFAVFFGDALAYCGFNPSRSFYVDVSNFDMKSQRKQDYFK